MTGFLVVFENLLDGGIKGSDCLPLLSLSGGGGGGTAGRLAELFSTSPFLDSLFLLTTGRESSFDKAE